jgi:hypothetical protein
MPPAAISDTALAWGESLDARQHGPARPSAARGQLGPGALCEHGCATAVSEIERLTQRLAGLASLPCASQRGTEVRERAGVLERGLGAAQRGDCLVQELESLLTALDEAGRAQGCAQRARGAEGARQPEFLCTEPAGLVQLVERG